MEYLVVMEVSQKQKYIFKTNRLAENIGASILIRDITEVLPERMAEETAEQTKAAQKLILKGGGKCVYAFSEESCAYEFVKRMSRRILEEYPGVELFMASFAYCEKKESIVEAMLELYDRLEKKKAGRESVFRLYDLGIARQCVSTQLPAVGVSDRGEFISAEVQTKLRAAKERQNELFSELLPQTEGKKIRFANEFTELGGTQGSKNYLAVAVIDGNKMGKKIKHFREEFCKKHTWVDEKFNSAYKEEIFRLSQEIDHGYKEAVKETIAKLFKNLERLVKEGTVSGKTDEDGTVVLPLRPLILAGDDICFVSDARIGTALAKDMLSNIEKIRIESLGNIKMCAAAGITMVKVTYPFFRAHELAEELCHSAKTLLEEKEEASVLDFHVAQGEIEGSLSEIRREKYNKGTLTSKPFYLHENERGCSIAVFEEHMEVLRSGAVGRSTLREYRSALSAGEIAARQFVSEKRMADRIKEYLGRDMPESYRQGRCIDFDVLEMLDLYHVLEGKNENLPG